MKRTFSPTLDPELAAKKEKDWKQAVWRREQAEARRNSEAAESAKKVTKHTGLCSKT
jgi:hypothetical protein